MNTTNKYFGKPFTEEDIQRLQAEREQAVALLKQQMGSQYMASKNSTFKWER